MSKAEEEEKQSGLTEASPMPPSLVNPKSDNSIPTFCDAINDIDSTAVSNEINCVNAEATDFNQGDVLLNKIFPYQNGEDRKLNKEEGDKGNTRLNGEEICAKSDQDYEEKGDIERDSLLAVSEEKTLSQIILSTEELNSLTREELTEKWNQQNSYIDFIHVKLEAALQEVRKFKEMNVSEERLKSQMMEYQRKEQYHIMRLATKEHEVQELGAQIDELKNLTTGGASLKHSLLDPAVNLLFERMKRDLDSTKSKMEETQNELAAWKFTPDSNTGKQLMARCRLLIKENEELGKMITSGKLAKLEGDLGLQRNFSDELKKSQSELDEFLQEMDEDTEGMQGTILYLQSQLRQAKERISQLSQQSTSNNNTPASATGDNSEYNEGYPPFLNNPPMEDESNCNEQDGTRLRYSPTPDSPSIKIDKNHSLESNGDERADVHNTIGCDDSDGPLAYSNERQKRTLESVVDDDVGEEEEGPELKRTCPDRTVDVIENGLPV